MNPRSWLDIFRLNRDTLPSQANQKEPAQPGAAQAYYEVAAQQEAHQDHEKAVQYFCDGFAREPDFAQAYLQLVDSLIRLSAFDEALTCCKLVLLLHQGCINRAELTCRQYIYNGSPDRYWLHIILGWIAHEIGAQGFITPYFQNAIRLYPEIEVQYPLLLQPVQKAWASEESVLYLDYQAYKRLSAYQFLLIKVWGWGLWSDIHHVLGQLVIAELTNRIPIVYWSTSSLYANGDEANVWESFFLPVSELQVADLIHQGYSFYPSRWTDTNLLDEDPNKGTDPIGAISFLHRPENVLVSDYYHYVSRLLPWIPKDHPLYGKTDLELYRFVFQKYVKLQPDITEEINRFYSQHMQGRRVIAAHIRYSHDKVNECSNILEINQLCLQTVRDYLSQYPDAFIFLLTDHEASLQQYQAEFGDRLIFTDCQRTSDIGVYWMSNTNRKSTGVEVLLDIYLAGRCDFFVGNGRSNPSCAVFYLKDWDRDCFKLFNQNFVTALL